MARPRNEQDEKPVPTPAEADERAKNMPKEKGGPEGPEPTRYRDWEKNGITSDF